MPTETLPDGPIIRGFDFNAGRGLDDIMGAMLTSGFQATALGQAVHEVNRMVRMRAHAWAPHGATRMRGRRMGAHMRRVGTAQRRRCKHARATCARGPGHARTRR